MSEAECSLPSIFTRGDARRAGISDRQMDRRIANGQWRAERRGMLSIAARDSGPPVAVLAAMRSIKRDAVASHATAARLLGLPRPLARLG